MTGLLVIVLEGIAALIDVIRDLYAFVRGRRRREKARQSDVTERLREQAMERASFQLGRLVFLLAILEIEVRKQQVTEADFLEIRKKTLEYLEHFGVGDETRMPSSKATAEDILRAAERSVYTHPGRVENAFWTGALVQVYQLCGEAVLASSTQQLKILAKHRAKIWASGTVLLPDDKSVRQAARILYDAAAEGSAPDQRKFQRSINTLTNWYGEMT